MRPWHGVRSAVACAERLLRMLGVLKFILMALYTCVLSLTLIYCRFEEGSATTVAIIWRLYLRPFPDLNLLLLVNRFEEGSATKVAIYISFDRATSLAIAV